MKIRWKAFFYENSEDSQVRTPPKNEHVNAFETGLYDMVRNIEFKIVQNSKVTCQNTSNALMKTYYSLFLLKTPTT